MKLTKSSSTANGSTFGLPSLQELRSAGSPKRMIDRFIAIDDVVDVMYRSSFHNSIVSRYEYACIIRDDKDIYQGFSVEKRVLALPKPLKGPDDALRALFNATEANPKRASKIIKRVEHLWKARKSAADVLAMLKRYEMEKAIPGVTNNKSDEEKPRQDEHVETHTDVKPESGSPSSACDEQCLVVNSSIAAQKKVGDFVIVSGTITSIKNGKMHLKDLHEA